MKFLRIATFIGGLLILVMALGFIFQLPFASSIWPWPDGRLSYLFVGSILAAVSVAALWIGWTGTWGALPAGALNILVIALLSAIYLAQLYLQDGQPTLLFYAILSGLLALVSLAAFLWSRKQPLADTRPIPRPVRISFGIFIAALLLAGGGLILKLPVFPWAVKPESSVLFGSIFLGDAFYFLYGLLHPRWHNALGQLLSFLAYDLVLIVPFLQLFGSIKPEFTINLIVYLAVLFYSGALAVYYLFLNPATRNWSPHS